MFNINDTQAKTQINNLWNHLDELAENNPIEYKKFIFQQMKNAGETIKPKIENIKVQPFLSLRFKLISILKNKSNEVHIHNENKNELLEVPKILFTFQYDQMAYAKKIIHNPKIYLNILHSVEYTKPTDENGVPLSDKYVTDDNKWKYVPTEFRQSGKGTSMSGTSQEFYDVIINSFVIDKMKTNEELKSSMLAYIVRKFVIFVNNKYILFVDNVKILETKKYKSIKHFPETFNIARENEKMNINNNAKIDELVPEEKIQTKSFIEDNKLIIPGKSQNYPGTNSFYNSNTQNDKKSLTNKKSSPTNNKNLIQEIKEKFIIEIKKTILSNNEMEVKFNFSEFKHENSCDIQIDNLDLQLSENEINLKLENTNFREEIDYDPIEMKFDFLVDTDKCTAKFNSQEKVLKLILIRKSI